MKTKPIEVTSSTDFEFVIKRVKNTVLWTYVISDLNSEEIIVTFLGG